MKKLISFYILFITISFIFGYSNVNAKELPNELVSEENPIIENSIQQNNESISKVEDLSVGNNNFNEDVIKEEDYIMENHNHRASVIINKLDDNGDYLPGAVFQLIDSYGNVIEEWTTENESFDILLAEGTYTLHEVSSPEGYIKAEDYTFTVKLKESNVIGTTDHDTSICEHYPTELYYIESNGKREEVYCINQGWDEPNGISYDGNSLTEDNIRSFMPDGDNTMTDSELYNKVLDIIYHRTQIEDGYLGLNNSEIRLITEYALKNYTSALYNNGTWARKYAYSETNTKGYIVDVGNGTSIGKLAQHWWAQHRDANGNRVKFPKKYVDYFNWLIRDEDHHPEDMTLYLYSTTVSSNDSPYQNLLGIRWITPDDAENTIKIDLVNNKKETYKTVSNSEIIPPVTGININNHDYNRFLFVVLLSIIGFGLSLNKKFN